MIILALRSSTLFTPSVAGTLFETHWGYWLALIAGAVILMLAGQARAEARLFKAGAVAGIVALLWIALAFLFTTPTERLYAVHKAMADAASKRDVDGILACMDRNFSINNLDMHGDTAADAAKNLIEARLKQLGIRQTHFTDFNVSFTPTGGVISRFVALTESDAGLIKSQWELLWNDREDSDWRVQDATLIKLGDQAVPRGEIVR
jgi:hypothetical protein